MPESPALSERQVRMLKAVRAAQDVDGGATPKNVAEQFESGSDARGVGQTLRRMPEHAYKTVDGTYKLTVKGAGAVRSNA